MARSAGIYLETRRTTQATSCNGSIFMMILRISGGKVSNVHPLRPCAFCLHREDTLRRFAPISLLLDSILFLLAIAINHNWSRSIMKIACILAYWWRSMGIFFGYGTGFPKFCKNLSRSKNSLICVKQRSFMSQSYHCDDSFSLKTSEKLWSKWNTSS